MRENKSVASTKIRILHIVNSGNIGGMERALYQLSMHMKHDGQFDVTVAVSLNSGPFIDMMRSSGINVWIADLNSGWDLTKFFKVREFMNGFNIHHFHSNMLFYVFASCFLRKKFRVYTNRGGARFLSFFQKMKSLAFGFCLRNYFSAYSGNTSIACDVAALRHNIPRESFSVLYNCIDFNSIRPSRDREEVLRELGLPAGIKIVGTSAHMIALKRIDKLIRLAKRLDSNTRVLILGDGTELNNLKNLAREGGVSEKVLFLGMKINPFDYVNAMDVFVLPSGPEESFGNSAVEAMALGVPTIVYRDGGGLVEHIENDDTGYIISDDQELFDRVSSLFNDNLLRKRIGQAGKDAIIKKYSVENMIRAYYNLYEKCSCVID